MPNGLKRNASIVVPISKSISFEAIEPIAPIIQRSIKILSMMLLIPTTNLNTAIRTESISVIGNSINFRMLAMFYSSLQMIHNSIFRNKKGIKQKISLLLIPNGHNYEL